MKTVLITDALHGIGFATAKRLAKEKSPLNMLRQWIKEENALGAPNAQQAVLATTDEQRTPHSRVVAIREISDKNLLFFSQRGTRKVDELTKNPKASITFWFELKQREVIIEGHTTPLSQEENECYWKTLPRERQLRFSAYAPTSGQPIASTDVLKKEEATLSQAYQTEIPMSPFYCGFHFIPKRLYFYTLGLETFSKVMAYHWAHDEWSAQILSP